MLALIGDSLTETEDVNAGGYVYGSNYRANWPDTALPLLGSPTTYNFAKAGGRFLTLDDGEPKRNFQAQIDALLAQTVTFTDIVIALGTNDIGWAINFGLPFSALGTCDDAMATDYGSLDVGIPCHSARKGIQRLRSYLPAARIYVCLPLQRGDVSTWWQGQVGVFADEIAKIARRYSCPVIDQWGEAGIVSFFEPSTGGTYLADGLHTKATGRDRQGSYIAAKLLGYTA